MMRPSRYRPLYLGSRRGIDMWIIIDGLDGSGKSTIADHLIHGLDDAGRSVLLIQHPNPCTAAGRLSRRFLRTDRPGASSFATIFYVLDILNSVRVQRRSETDDVVFVRYILSVAYLPEGLARFAYKFFCKLLGGGDLRIYVDTDPDTAMERIVARGDPEEIFENPERLKSTRDKMIGLSEDWTVIDNGRPLKSVLCDVDSMIAEIVR
jgi:dTMP kinase